MSNNILYICGGRSFHSQNPGRKIEGVVTCWRDIGYEVEHVCGADILSENNSAGYGAQKHHGKWYRKLSLMKAITHSVSEYKDTKHDAKVYEYLKKLSVKNKPMLVWERSSRLHKAGLDLAKELEVPYVLEWKDHLVPYPVSLFRKKALKVELLKNYESSYIVVESRILKDQLSEEGVDASKIHVALNAINPDEFIPDIEARSKIRKQYDVAEGQVLIGYLGSYAFYHDAKRLVLAADILSKTSSNAFKILMVGNGKEYEDTRRLAMDLGLLNELVFMQDAVEKSQVPDILSALDIAVLPGSTDIICPIKVQEYMYMGLASVVPDYGCNREVIVPESDGMLFEPHNELSLSNSLRFLIDNKEKMKLIGERAKAKAINEFTWEKTWGKVLRNIEDDMAGGS